MSIGRLLWRVALWIGVPIGLAVALVAWRVAATLDAWIEQARPFAQITRGSSFVHLNGDVGVDQLAITPHGERAGTMRASKITLHTPGLWWLLKSGVVATRSLPESFGISIDELDSDALNLGDGDALVGQTSAALFDHAGCVESSFGEAQLAVLGLPSYATRIHARYQRQSDGQLRALAGITREGSAAVEFELRLRLAAGDDVDMLALMGANFESVQWTFHDAGLIAARNTHCSAQTQVSPEQFVAQHVAAARGIARAAGLLPDDAFWSAYGEFALNGGSLRVLGSVPRPLPLVAMRQQLAGADNTLRWQVAIDDQPLAATRIAMIETTAPDKPLSLTQQLEAEMQADRERQAGIVAGLKTPAAAPSGVGSDTAVATTAPAPGVSAARSNSAWQDVEYPALSTRLGATLRIRTIHGSVRNGILEQWTAAGMVLRLSARDGGIPLSLRPADIERIEARAD